MMWRAEFHEIIISDKKRKQDVFTVLDVHDINSMIYSCDDTKCVFHWTLMSLLSPPKNESCSLISMEFFWNNRLGRASIKSVTTTRFAGENILAGSKQIVQNNQVICCIVHQMLFIITSCYQGIIIRKYWMSMPTLILWGFNTIYLFNFVVKGRACSLINLIDYLNALQTASVRA